MVDGITGEGVWRLSPGRVEVESIPASTSPSESAGCCRECGGRMGRRGVFVDCVGLLPQQRQGDNPPAAARGDPPPSPAPCRPARDPLRGSRPVPVQPGSRNSGADRCRASPAAAISGVHSPKANRTRMLSDSSASTVSRLASSLLVKRRRAWDLGPSTSPSGTRHSPSHSRSRERCRDSPRIRVRNGLGCTLAIPGTSRDLAAWPGHICKQLC